MSPKCDDCSFDPSNIGSFPAVTLTLKQERQQSENIWGVEAEPPMAEPSTESCSFIFHLSSLAETQPLMKSIYSSYCKSSRVQGFGLTFSVGDWESACVYSWDSASSAAHLTIIMAVMVLYDFGKRVGNKLPGENEDQWEWGSRKGLRAYANSNVLANLRVLKDISEPKSCFTANLQGLVRMGAVGFRQCFQPVEM